MASLQCVCGTRYDPDRTGEVQMHLERHEEWAGGVRVPPLPSDQVIERWAETELLLVRRGSPPEQRERADRVARRAKLDTPFDTPAYVASDADPEVQVFLARQGDRAVGFALLRPRPRWGWWSWDDYDAERRPSTPVAPMTSWTVEQVWTLPRVQQQGLAKRILDAAARVVEQPVSSFGWRRPFTPSGESLVRRCCPEGFWVPD
jgi:GNAT superfamily N-acetyltransferase